MRVLAQLSFNLTVNGEIVEKMSQQNNPTTKGFLSASQSKSTIRKSSSIDSSMNGTRNAAPLREGVRDMLIKHHLFSWDL